MFHPMSLMPLRRFNLNWLEKAISIELASSLAATDFQLALKQISTKYRYIFLFVNTPRNSRASVIDIPQRKLTKSWMKYIPLLSQKRSGLYLFVITEPMSISSTTLFLAIQRLCKKSLKMIIATANPSLEPLSDQFMTLDPDIMNRLVIPFSNIDWWSQNPQDTIQQKNRNISLLNSNKNLSYAHLLRTYVSISYQKYLDVYTGSGLEAQQKLSLRKKTLLEYRFSLIIENTYEQHHVSEQIIDAFLSMTIPIYWGGGILSTAATSYYSLSKFDPGGIVMITHDSHLKKLLPILNKSFYESRLSSIYKNRQIALQLLGESGWDGRSCLVDPLRPAQRFTGSLFRELAKRVIC